MSVLLPILAQPLAPDYIWLALLLLAALACIHRPNALRGRMAEHKYTRQDLHEPH